MSRLRQGSQNSLEKPRLMEDQQEFQEEVLDFMGLGSCMPREAWRLPSPQPLQKNSADAKATFADNDDVAPQQVPW